MTGKVVKYIIIIGLLALLGFNSVYFRKLDEVTRESDSGSFNAATFSRKLYNEKLLIMVDSAVELNVLVSFLRANPEQAFGKYSHALTIGNIRYFLVRGEGTISSVNSSDITVVLNDATEKTKVTIATEFIYGNAIRDASGLVRLNDFTNTSEINNISENINNIIRSEVIPPFVKQATAGSKVRFAGAIELNRKYLDLDAFEVVPIKLVVPENSPR